MLENLINYYGAGDYTIGLAPQNWSSRQLVFPINEIEGCRVGARVPKLSEDQQKQMVDQLVSFWKKAEKGTFIFMFVYKFIKGTKSSLASLKS